MYSKGKFKTWAIVIPLSALIVYLLIVSVAGSDSKPMLPGNHEYLPVNITATRHIEYDKDVREVMNDEYPDYMVTEIVYGRSGPEKYTNTGRDAGIHITWHITLEKKPKSMYTLPETKE